MQSIHGNLGYQRGRPTSCSGVSHSSVRFLTPSAFYIPQNSSLFGRLSRTALAALLGLSSVEHIDTVAKQPCRFVQQLPSALLEHRLQHMQHT